MVLETKTLMSKLNEVLFQPYLILVTENRLLICSLGLIHQRLLPHELQLQYFIDVDTIIQRTATVQEKSLSKYTESFMFHSTEVHCPLHLPSPIYLVEVNKI